SLKSGGQIEQIRESQGTHALASPGTPNARRAMNEINSAFVQDRDLLVKIRSVHIQIPRTRDVAGVEFLFRAHVEDHILFVQPKLLELSYPHTTTGAGIVSSLRGGGRGLISSGRRCCFGSNAQH